jgi:hypothetical protein
MHAPLIYVAKLWRNGPKYLIYNGFIFAWGATGRKFESCHSDYN